MSSPLPQSAVTRPAGPNLPQRVQMAPCFWFLLYFRVPQLLGEVLREEGGAPMTRVPCSSLEPTPSGCSLCKPAPDGLGSEMKHQAPLGAAPVAPTVRLSCSSPWPAPRVGRGHLFQPPTPLSQLPTFSLRSEVSLGPPPAPRLDQGTLESQVGTNGHLQGERLPSVPAQPACGPGGSWTRLLSDRKIRHIQFRPLSPYQALGRVCPTFSWGKDSPSHGAWPGVQCPSSLNDSSLGDLGPDHP